MSIVLSSPHISKSPNAAIDEDPVATPSNKKAVDFDKGTASRPEGRSNYDKLVFCGKTALELAHFLNDANATPSRTVLASLPARAPSDADLQRILAPLCIRNRPAPISRPVHLLFRNNSHHRKTPLRIPHRCTRLPKGRPLLKISENMFVVSPAFALCELADGADELDLLLLLWEACGNYRSTLTWTENAYETTPATSLRSLTRFIGENSHLHGSASIKRALRYVRDGSASARESQIALFMGLPIRYGGFNLGLPQMNYRVNASPEARLIAGRTHFRCDLCWPERKVDVEYQSDESHEGKIMRIKDSRRTNALISMGWNVINITNSEVKSLSTLEQIAERIRKMLRKRSYPRTHELDVRRLRLHRGLGIVDDEFFAQ